MSAPHLNNATSAEQIQTFLENNGGVAVIDVFATWCGPCKLVAPYVDQKNKSTGIPLITIDVDEAEDLVGEFEISAMPTFLVIKGQWNNEIARFVGGGKDKADDAFNKALENK